MIYVLTSIIGVYYLLNSLLLHYSFNSNAWDLGIFTQILFNFSQGRFWQYSFRPYSYLADHFSPLLLILSPLGLLKSAWPLLVAQALGLSLGVFVIYFLSNKIIHNSRLSFLVAASFALNPFSLQIINFDFHPDAFFPVFFFAALYFLLAEREWLSSFFLLLLMLTREDSFLLILLFCFLSLFFFKQRKLAFGWFIISLSYFCLVNFWLMPLIRGPFSGPITEHYAYLGGDLPTIFRTVVSHPFLIVSKTFGLQERTTVLRFLSSTGFLSLFEPLIILVSWPIFASHLLSQFSFRITLSGHYASQMLIPLYLSLILALKRLISRGGEYQLTLRGRRLGSKDLVAGYLLLITITNFILFSPLPPSFMAEANRFHLSLSRLNAFSKIKDLIPEKAGVSAQSNLVPHLASRQQVYEFPRLEKDSYLVLDDWGSVSGQSRQAGYDKTKREIEDLGYRTLFRSEGFWLYRKLTN